MIIKMCILYLHSQQGVHGRHQQINCNDVGCISMTGLEFRILMIDQHDFHQVSIETTDEVAYWQPEILATIANLIWMPLFALLSFCPLHKK